MTISKSPLPDMPKPLPHGLIIRELTNSDIPSLADLLNTALGDGTIYQFPNWLDSPEDTCRRYIQWLREVIYDRTTLVRVALVPVVPTLHSPRSMKVVGFSSWRRKVLNPKGDGNTICVDWKKAALSDYINPPLTYLESKYNDLFYKIHPRKQVAALTTQSNRSLAIRAARSKTLSPQKKTACLELSGMATHNDFQGCGIASTLVHWGMDEAVKHSVPVYVGGEARGVGFYEKALGFRRLPKSEYWLDTDGNAINREDIEVNQGWKKENGGVSGSELVWCPPGVDVDEDGFLLSTQ